MKDFASNLINLYGEKGKEWLTNLPIFIKQLAAEFELSDLKPIKNLSYNYVLSGFQMMQPIVLKLGLDSNALRQEALALHAFSGYGAVNILAEKEGMLLLEGAVPGTALKSYFPQKDNDSISIAVKCLIRLHQAAIPDEHQFPHIKDWLSVLDKEYNIPLVYLNKARRLRDELVTSLAEPVLLHGDLHHNNILLNGNDWVVIDPKGIIGEPAYETAAFIRNPIPQLLACNDSQDRVNARIKRFAEILELPEQRIADWCYVQSVLSWVWALEDNCDTAYFKNLTELFELIAGSR